jgi:hypothetical protein
MSVTRLLSLILTTCAVLVTVVGMGVAQGQPRAVGHVVLCVGAGTQVVAIDATGTPVASDTAHCPDCAIALVGGPIVSGTASAMVPMGLSRHDWPDLAQIRGTAGMVSHPSVRAPPLV